jgi:hypothetical protein
MVTRTRLIVSFILTLPVSFTVKHFDNETTHSEEVIVTTPFVLEMKNNFRLLPQIMGGIVYPNKT